LGRETLRKHEKKKREKKWKRGGKGGQSLGEAVAKKKRGENGKKNFCGDVFDHGKERREAGRKKQAKSKQMCTKAGGREKEVGGWTGGKEDVNLAYPGIPPMGRFHQGKTGPPGAILRFL